MKLNLFRRYFFCSFFFSLLSCKVNELSIVVFDENWCINKSEANYKLKDKNYTFCIDFPKLKDVCNVIQVGKNEDYRWFSKSCCKFLYKNRRQVYIDELILRAWLTFPHVFWSRLREMFWKFATGYKCNSFKNCQNRHSS